MLLAASFRRFLEMMKSKAVETKSSALKASEGTDKLKVQVGGLEEFNTLVNQEVVVFCISIMTNVAPSGKRVRDA